MSANTDIESLAHQLMMLIKENRLIDGINRFYDPDVISIEAVASDLVPEEVQGVEACRQKVQWWLENHELHDLELAGPFMGETQFAFYFRYDFTPNSTGQRVAYSQMGLYTVSDGKVIREEFFYSPGKQVGQVQRAK